LRLCCRIETRHLWLPRLSTTEEEISVPIILSGTTKKNESTFLCCIKNFDLQSSQMVTTQLVWLCVRFGNRDPGFENSREFLPFFISRFFRTKSPRIPGWCHYVTTLKILHEIFHFVLRKQKFVYTAYSVVEQTINVEIRSCSTANAVNRVMQWYW